jgi:alkanesulfonate monooxygenase SsuD/methylene tetrahydromethanopterin reductase-like flavin-dependent oxidoreductase (luciferase family)
MGSSHASGGREEYSHSSAPEVFLAAASQRTRRIRLGHGIIQTSPLYNHPARTAERVATLDLVSGGRVEFGSGESATLGEMGGFNVDPLIKREQWREGLEVVIRCLSEQPFTGVQGRFISMPPRNVVPKPMQRPHPPLWVAASRRETIMLAAELGLGALTFAFIDPEKARGWIRGPREAAGALPADRRARQYRHRLRDPHDGSSRRERGDSASSATRWPSTRRSAITFRARPICGKTSSVADRSAATTPRSPSRGAVSSAPRSRLERARV